MGEKSCEKCYLWRVGDRIIDGHRMIAVECLECWEEDELVNFEPHAEVEKLDRMHSIQNIKERLSR
jgi:hypothetical protein